MQLQVSWEMIGLIGAILIHAGSTIWWAAKVTASLDSINNRIGTLDREMEKRDNQLERVWARVDELRDMIPGTK